MEIDIFAKIKGNEMYLCTTDSSTDEKHAVLRFKKILDKRNTLVPQTRRAWLKKIATKKFTIIAKTKS